jgi:CRP/FNR family transcriptional regulator
MKDRLLVQDCTHCIAKSLSDLCNLSGEELEDFLKIQKFLIFDKHQTVFYEGKPCHGIYILCSGKVKLIQSSRQGQQHILRIINPGELIEKNGLYNMNRHSVTCETLERSQINFIEKADFVNLVKKHKELALKLINALSRELELAQQKISHSTFETARERLAEVLLQLGDQYGTKKENEVAIELYLTREELAELTGTSLETLVRLLSSLKKDKIIRTDGKKISLVNLTRLKQIGHLASTVPPS